jgi:hypothetical protein
VGEYTRIDIAQDALSRADYSDSGNRGRGGIAVSSSVQCPWTEPRRAVPKMGEYGGWANPPQTEARAQGDGDAGGSTKAPTSHCQ